VGEENNQTFFKEISADLVARYPTEIYRKKTYNTPLLYGRLNRWAFRNGIASMLRRNDVCFFEWASEYLMVASHEPKHCAIVTRLHSFELFDWAPRINWDAVDRVILVRQAMQEKFSSLYPDQARKTVVIYNGRSLDRFKPSDRREFSFNLGMLGHIAPIKRVYEVILMLDDLVKQGYQAHLHIAGEPIDLRYTAAVYRLVDKLSLKERVTFYGYVTDTPAWLQKIDILISNSYWEGQQVALLEAIASGCYCLAHFWDGVDEMLPQENLYITGTELQQKVIAYSELPEGEKQRRQADLRRIACERFDIEKTKAGIRQVIEDARRTLPLN
jgi:glycosyltransferase involved in cell wall biosynthesis